MTTSLGLPVITSGQVDKFVTANTQSSKLDEAITDMATLDFTSADITLSDAQVRTFFAFDCTNVSVPRVLDMDSPTGGIKRFFLVRSPVANSDNVTVRRGTTDIAVIPDTEILFYMDGTANGLVKMTASAASVAFTDITDVPSSYTNQEKKLLQVNATPNAIEFTGPVGQMFFGLVAESIAPENSTIGDEQVSVECDGGFMDDGTPFGPTGRLLLDVANSNGANGLDTGTKTEGWYKLWIIQREDTLAFATLYSRAIDTTRDEFQSTDNADLILHKADGSTDLIAQGFQPTRTERLLAVDLWLENITSDPALDSTWWVTIEADAAGEPDGTPLATSYIMQADRVFDVTKRIRVMFPEPPALTAATQYHIVVHADYADSDTVGLQFAGNTSSSYALGICQEHDGVSTWTASTDILDMKFETIGENYTAPVMPANYTQKVHVGYIKMDNIADIESFLQVDRRIEFFGDIGITGTALDTTELADLSDFIPWTDCLVEFTFTCSSTTPLHTFGPSPYAYGLADADDAPPKDQRYQFGPVTAAFTPDHSQMCKFITKGQCCYFRQDGTPAGTLTIRPIAFTWRN